MVHILGITWTHSLITCELLCHIQPCPHMLNDVDKIHKNHVWYDMHNDVVTMCHALCLPKLLTWLVLGFSPCLPLLVCPLIWPHVWVSSCHTFSVSGLHSVPLHCTFAKLWPGLLGGPPFHLAFTMGGNCQAPYHCSTLQNTLNISHCPQRHAHCLSHVLATVQAHHIYMGVTSTQASHIITCNNTIS